MLIDSKKNIWDEFEFESQTDLENVVEENYQSLFGDQSIYFSNKNTRSENLHGMRPDAYAIDVENKKWYLVTVELADHGVYKHIVPKVTKQLRAAESTQTRALLKHRFMTEIKAHINFQNVFRDLSISDHDVEKVLEEILAKKPLVAIPIDNVHDDLEAWAASLQYHVKVLKVSRYKSRDDHQVIYEFPDFDENEHVAFDTVDPELPKDGAPLIRALINAAYLKNGQTLTMFHKGKPFRAVLSETGHLVLPSGDKHSASIAALKCIQTVTPTRRQQNGWITWKTAEGKTLEQIRNDFYTTKLKAA